MALSPKHKCLIKYIFDKCDVSGVWSPNWTLASAHIGEPVTIDDVAPFGSQVEFVGRKIFIIDFIQFQYGTLSEKCKPHVKIIALLKKYGLYERVLKGYLYPIETLQEKEEDKEEEAEKETEQEQEGGAGEGQGKFLVPQMVEIFSAAIPTYPAEKYRDGAALLSIAAFLCQRGNLRGAPEHNATAVLEAWEQLSLVIADDKFYCQKSLSTISNHIQEIVQKALHGDKSKSGTSGKRDLAAEAKAALLKRGAVGQSG